MDFSMTVTTTAGSGTTTGRGRDDLLVATDFIANCGFKDPDADFTISAESGPDYAGRFGDITAIRLDVTR